MSKNIRTEAVDHLFEAILCLKDMVCSCQIHIMMNPIFKY